MVASSAASPLLCGAVSLDGAPLPPPPAGATALWEEGGVCVLATAEAPDLVVERRRDGLLALLGRIDAPGDAWHRLRGESLQEVQGSFVLCTLRAGGAEVSLSTDRFGFRPLLYWRRTGRLLFATHLSGLALLAPDALPSVAEEALLHYYNFGFTPNDRTLLDGVRKVPPATTLSVRGGTVRLRPYDSLRRLYEPERYRGVAEEEVCRRIDERLRRAVERRTRGAARAGIALSGGVDSGFVAAKAVESGAAVTGYTLAYGSAYDEFDRVDRLARTLSIPVRRITLAPGEILENYERASRTTSEPLGFNNATMRFVGRAARADGISVLLDGDGTDRLFLGQTRYLRYERLVAAYRWLARTRLLPLAAPLLRAWPHGELRKAGHHFENWRRGIAPYGERGLGRLAGGYDEAYERRIYRLAVARHHAAARAELGGSDFGLSLTYQAIQMCPEMFFHDVAELYQEAGVRAVPAFWDTELVSLAISLPTAWKLRKGQTKYILRRAAARSLDPAYWMLPKIGLQSAYHFAVASPAGAAWRRHRLDQARASAEAERLRALVPGGAVQPERLLGLVVWKEAHGLA